MAADDPFGIRELTCLDLLFPAARVEPERAEGSVRLDDLPRISFKHLNFST